jgi:hypothetical protein
MIPAKIYTYWEGPMPEYVRIGLESITARSQVQVVILNDDTAADLVGSTLHPSYRNLTNIAQKVDCIRLAILLNEGGMWCDADTIFLHSAKALFETPGEVIGFRWPVTNRLLNGYILSERGSAFMKLCVDRVNEHLAKSMTKQYFDSPSGCFFGEDILCAVPQDGLVILPVDTLLPVQFPANPHIWTDRSTIYEHMTERTIAVGLNHSHMTAETRRQSVADLLARNDLLGSIIRLYIEGSTKKSVFLMDGEELSFWNLRVPRPAPAAQQKQKATPKAPVKQKSPMFPRNEGLFAVYAVAIGEYQWYAPLFVHSMRMSYPKIPVVIGHTDLDPRVASLLSDVSMVDLSSYGISDARARALRFLVDDRISAYDYVLMQDIDMLIYPEDVPIVDQHVYHMRHDMTICYENWIEEYWCGELPRLSGIHFITKAWWPATAVARGKLLEKLKTLDSLQWHEDEVWLGSVVSDAHLPMPPVSSKLWRNHGLHLGDWRRSPHRNAIRPNINAWQSLHMAALLRDSTFMSLVTEFTPHLPCLTQIMKTWKSYFT